MTPIRVVGFDPSLRHWGISQGEYYLATSELIVLSVDVIEPALPKHKSVRVNSKDLEAARQLAQATLEATQDAQAIFVEVPHGSQSARAMAGYGICLGILGTLRSQGKQFYELTEAEVKLATVGHRKCSKQDMIDWIVSRHPEVSWSPHARIEHQTDATATIYAGIQHPQFLQTLQLQLDIQGTANANYA